MLYVIGSLFLCVTATDPELHLDAPGIIKHYGYPFELHEPVAEDGFIIAVHRIPGPRAGSRTPRIFETGNNSCPVIILQHGLLTTFILADAGFDVWMPNSRGNVYSNKHARMRKNDPKMWKFSWQEMARYDVPAVIDYVLKINNKSQLYYLGHSQGTLIMFTAAAENRKIAGKIKHFFGMGPIISERNIGGSLVPLANAFRPLLTMGASMLGMGQVFADSRMSTMVCGGNPLLRPICDFVTYNVNGRSSQTNKGRIAVYNAHFPAGTSVNNLVHWGQMISGPTRHFDYGNSAENRKAYGSATPPLIDYTTYNIPSTLYYGEDDHLADFKDVQYLLKTFNKSIIRKAVNVGDYSHVDFLQGIRAKTEIYDDIIKYLRQLEGR